MSSGQLETFPGTLEVPETFRILLVDDNEQDRASLRAVLADAEVASEIIETSDIEQAFLPAQRDSFDCILADNLLGDHNGLSILRALREAGVNTPVIVVTAHGNEQIAVDLMKAGVADYLPRSTISRQSLARSVRNAIRLHRAREIAARAAEAEREQAAVAIENARLYEALRRGEERYRFLADSIPQMVWTTEADGRADYFNQRWQDYTGQSPQQSHGWGWKEALHPDDIARTTQVWTECFSTGKEYEIEYRLLRGSDRAYRWHLARAFAMRDEQGKIVKWVGTCTDIHDQKTTEAALAAANTAKDQFLAVLSHEMRTPLMPVLMTVQSLLNEKNLTPEIEDGLDVIRRNVELEARLIDDLLDLTRISRGKLQLNFDTVDLHAMIRSAMDICSIDVVGKQLGTTLDLSASKHHVRGDPARLQQVFWNLIKNAVKFTPQNGYITVHTYDDPGGSMKVRISDTGIGIEPQALGRIFDAFEQGDRTVSRQFGGLGLGLAISKALIDLHGGKLTATSAGTGQGSTFIIELRPSAPAAASSETAPPAQAAQVDRGSIRILLVDDHPDTSRAMSRLLERMGYAVKTADTVRGALAVAEEHSFDLLISDIGLPDGSGLELMRQLLQRHPPIRGIALSGFGMEEDVQRSKAAGFYEHLTKPINFKRLETAIADLTAKT